MFFPLGSPALLTLGSAIENDDDDEDEEFGPIANGSAEESCISNDSLSNGTVSSNTIKNSSSVLVVCSNRERLIVAVLTLKTLFLYSANPQTLLVAYTRSKKSLLEKGFNERLIWKPDSSSVAITTSLDHLLFYKVEFDGNSQVYEMCDSRKPVYKRNSLELIVQQRIPKARVSPCATVKLASKASSVVSLKEELIVGLSNGWLHRLLWNGHVMEDFSVPVGKIPFFYELESKPEYLAAHNATPRAGHVGLTHFVDLVYSPLIGGFGYVLSSGRAGLMIAQSPRYHPSELRAIWAPAMQDAACCAANHKYRLLAFGCRSSAICAYTVDETSGSLVQAYRVNLATIDNPVVSSQLGSVQHLEWSPYGTTLGVTWTKCGVAGFSVFGSQLWFDNVERTPSFDWGTEGHQLWLAGRDLRLWQCVRPPNVNNSAMGHNKRLTMVGADSLYLSPLRSFEAKVYAPMQSYWQRVSVPWNYIGQWWPIRYCALDESQESLAVAGTRGLVHCQLQNQKWRLFGNETQEREMTVTGGLCFWKEFVVCGCYDIERQVDEVRFYPRWFSLDNVYCSKSVVEAQVLFFNIRHDVFLTFDVDAKCTLYSMRVEKRSNASVPDSACPQVRLDRCAEILVKDLVPHPACVISAQLLVRGGDDGAAKFCGDVDAILLNIAGRLIMLSPQSNERRPASGTGVATLLGSDGPVQNQLEPPLLVASFVEDVFMDIQWQQAADGAAVVNGDKPHLSQALWIQCGCRGMRVWMPLFPKSGERLPFQPPQQQFISKRIMLPFELSSMYSLAVSSSECLVLGVEACFLNGAASVHRKNEVFLHHILRQLLKRNLGLYALEIAGTCRNLKYFPHVLELLLHSVLEEEATSSEPIPDPLLPRVVAFLQEFPEFLQTIAHCARKTEMALWKHLFQTVGSPKDLFEVCIREKQLETAASYFIILQNMESSYSCKHHATMLLQAALENGRTSIADEVVRFLKALDPEDLESPPTTPLMFNKQPNFPRLPMLNPSNVEDADALVFQPPHPITRQRHSSVGNVSPNDSSGVDGATAATFAPSSSGRKQSSAKQSFYHASEMAAALIDGAVPAGTRRALSKTNSAIDGVIFPASSNGTNEIRKSSLTNRSDASMDVYINSILTRHGRQRTASYGKNDEKPLGEAWMKDANMNKVRDQRNSTSNPVPIPKRPSNHQDKQNGAISHLRDNDVSSDYDNHPLVSAVTPTSSDEGTNCILM